MPKLVNVSDDPTKWSRIEATLKQCRAVCTALAIDQLPSENWFRRRDVYKKREVYEFELESWFPLLHLIREMGGFKAIRACLSQTNPDGIKWTNIQRQHSGSFWMSIKHVLELLQTVCTRRKTVQMQRRYARKLASFIRQQESLVLFHNNRLQQSKNTSGGQERIDNYEQNKAGKLEFNKDNPNFIHLHVDNCWKDDFLTDFFRPYIGDPEVQIHDKIGELARTIVQSSMLSIADSTIQECKKLCDRLEVEEIPCRQWFLRTGKFADRKVEDWECGHLVYDITKLGGWNKVRLFCKLAKHAEDTATACT